MSDSERKSGRKTKAQKLYEETEHYSAEIKAVHSKMSEFLAQIESYYKAEILPKFETINSVAEKLPETMKLCDAAHSDISSSRDKVAVFYDELFTDTEKEQSYETLIREFHDSIKETNNEVDKLRIAISDGHTEVFGKDEKNYRKLNPDETKDNLVLLDNEKIIEDKNGNPLVEKIVHVDGKIAVIDGLMSSVSSFLGESVKDFSKKMEVWEEKARNLHEKIESHLPNATSIGLAYSYAKAKDEHAEKALKWEKYFAISIGVILFAMFLMNAQDMYQYYQSGVNPLSFDYLKLKSLQLVPFILPLIWFAYHANKVANEHRHLKEEYLHKWAAATAYVGMKKQLDDIEDEDNRLLSRLIHNTVTIHSQNPNSFFMRKDKTDNPVFRLLGCVPSKNIASFLGIKEVENVAKFLSQTGESLEKIILSEKADDDKKA